MGHKTNKYEKYILDKKGEWDTQISIKDKQV